jgi:hypothetical protein
VEHQVFPGTTPDKKGAIDSYRIFFEASPDMTAEIHDMAATGDRVAIRATYRGTDVGGFIPGMPATGKAYEMGAMYVVRVSEEARSPNTGASSTPWARWLSSDSCRHRRAAEPLSDDRARFAHALERAVAIAGLKLDRADGFGEHLGL